MYDRSNYEGIAPAIMLVQAHHYDRAEMVLRDLLAKNPDNVLALLWLARTLLYMGRRAEALGVVNHALGREPNVAEAHYVRAKVLLGLERTTDAIEASREALRLDSHNPEHWSLLASLYMSLRDWKKMEEAALMGLQCNPRHVYCLNNYALALRNQGQKVKAAEILRQALQLDPEDSVTRANQGWQHFENGEFEKALGHFKEALRRDPFMEWAQQGVRSVLKEQHSLYRWFAGFKSGPGDLTKGQMLGLVLGLYFTQGIVRWLWKMEVDWHWIVWVAVAPGYFFYLFPFINSLLVKLVLLGDPFGRLVLLEEDRRAALIAAACLGSAALLALIGLATWRSFWGLGMLEVLFLLVPIEWFFQLERLDHRKSMAVVIGVLVGVIVLTLAWEIAGIVHPWICAILFGAGWLLSRLMIGGYFRSYETKR